jgi:hypothetical protein
MKKALTYGAGLIALYLVVYYYTGAGALLTDIKGGVEGTIQAFQGRATGAGQAAASAYPTPG